MKTNMIEILTVNIKGKGKRIGDNNQNGGERNAT